MVRRAMLLMFCNILLFANGQVFDSGEPTVEPFFMNLFNFQLTNLQAYDQEVVYPIRESDGPFHGPARNSDLAERLKCHTNYCTFIMFTKWGGFRLIARRNRVLIPPIARYKIFLHLKFVDEFKRKWMENCYFQGEEHGHPNSHVSLSNCDGLRGFIALQNQAFLIIPMKPDNFTAYPHLLIRITTNHYLTCDEKLMTSFRPMRRAFPIAEADDDLKRLHSRNVRRNVSTSNIGSIATETKYMELNLLVDKDAAKWTGMDLDATFNFFLESLNTLDLFLQRLNVRMSLVRAEFWLSKNRAKVEPDLLETLKRLARFRARRTRSIHNDITLLLTASDHNITQMAYFANSMCTMKAAGLLSLSDKFHPLYTSMQMAYLIGRMLGMDHDGDGEELDGKEAVSLMGKPCRVQEAVQKNYIQLYQYTDHSKQEFLELLNSGQGHCLFNFPLRSSSLGSCGNKIIDEGEECDCGTMDECASVDPCCAPLTCKLKTEAQCPKGPCCEECQYATSKTVCRPSVDPICDFSEFCMPYPKAECPANAYKRDGTVCGDNNDGYCYHGRCIRADQQCQELEGPEYSVADDACFRKFNTMGSPLGHCGIDQWMKPVACTMRCVVLQEQRKFSKVCAISQLRRHGRRRHFCMQRKCSVNSAAGQRWHKMRSTRAL